MRKPFFKLGNTLCALLFASATVLSNSANATEVRTSLVNALNEAIQDEYHSQQTYLAVTDDFGEVLPFVNIVQAETRHIDALSSLYEARELDVPTSKWTAMNVPRFESIEAACKAAIKFETKNVAMYNRLLKSQVPTDVRQVFENLRAASKNNHLPAFRRCANQP